MLVERYKNNPNLKGLRIVTTANGEKEYRCNCAHIAKKYYIKNQDCFYVNNTWYRLESGKIMYDYEKKEWFRIGERDELSNGIVGIEGDQVQYGSFTPNPYNNVKVNDNLRGTVMAINSSILKAAGYVEDINRGDWYAKGQLSANSIRQISEIRNDRNFNNRGYNIEDNPSDFEKKKRLFKEYVLPISKEAKGYAKLLGDISFGLECEVGKGYIADYLQNRMGIVVCRDGSIGGPELVTIPMGGAKGVQNIKEMSKAMIERCSTDINCSFHIHIGNIPTSRNFLAAVYVLGYKIQDELFTMFPYYKTDPRGVKQKNYNQKLKKLGIHPLKVVTKDGYKAYVDDVFNKIFTWCSGGIPPDDHLNRRVERHPNGQKWTIPGRYFHINFINMLFSPRKTLEFRIHEPTINATKMSNFLFICNAIIQYAICNEKTILTTEGKIPLVEVLNYYKDHFPKNSRAAFLSKYLKAYFDERVAQFKKDYNNEDVVSQKYLDNDKKYVFNYEGITELF